MRDAFIVRIVTDDRKCRSRVFVFSCVKREVVSLYERVSDRLEVKRQAFLYGKLGLPKQNFTVVSDWLIWLHGSKETTLFIALESINFWGVKR